MAKKFSHGYALLIGVSDNAVQRWALPDVSKDIHAVAEVLCHPERCGYLPDNVRVLEGSEATRQSLLDNLDWLTSRIKDDATENTTVVLYFSGHGFQDKAAQPVEYYLVPYDARENNQDGGPLTSSVLRASDFSDAVSVLRPRRLLVVLDCCHAAGMDVKDVTNRSSRYVPSAIPTALFVGGEKAGGGALEALSQGYGRAILTSSQAEQSSYIRRDGAMSIFTYYFIEALTGHAQPQAGATEVLVSDVVGHVTRRVKECSLREEHPVPQEPHYVLSGNFPVALLLGGQGLPKGTLPPDPLVIPAAPRQESTVSSHRTVSAHDITRAAVVTGDGNVVQFSQSEPSPRKIKPTK